MKHRHITVHSSATQPMMKYDVEWCRKLHKGKGWSDIGYHFMILPDGSVEEGRALSRQGAHVSGHNSLNIGVCMVGGVDKHGHICNNYTTPQFDALRDLLTDLMAKYQIPLSEVKGHRDWFGDTNGDGVIDSRDWLKECPCFDVQTVIRDWL